MTTEASIAGKSTRERLLDAGLRLFAERGFSVVTVGDIERAVDLVPRRGAMYRHFASKEALLEAAVETCLTSVAATRSRYEGDAEVGIATLTDLGAFILAEMDRQQLITRILERDGDRLPTLRDRFRCEVSDAGYRAMAEILRGWARATGRAEPNPDSVVAQAVLLVGALINVRRSTWTLGESPQGLADAALVDGWTRLCRAALDCPDLPSSGR